MARRRPTVDGDLQYPIDEAWRAEVLKLLKVRGAQARLARELECSPGTLNELLHNGRRSNLVPRINAYFGWDPPQMPATGSTDQHEIEVFLKKMGRTGREIFKNLQTLGGDDPERLAAVAAVIAQLAAKPTND